MPEPDAHAAFGALLASLDLGRAHDNYELAIANRLFAQDGFALRAPYAATLRDDYGAEVASVDFRNPAQAKTATPPQMKPKESALSGVKASPCSTPMAISSLLSVVRGTSWASSRACIRPMRPRRHKLHA